MKKISKELITAYLEAQGNNPHIVSQERYVGLIEPSNSGIDPDMIAKILNSTNNPRPSTILVIPTEKTDIKSKIEDNLKEFLQLSNKPHVSKFKPK